MTIGKVAPRVGATVLLPCGCPAIEVRDIGLHQDGCGASVNGIPFPHDAPTSPPFVQDDGGRAAAGYRGNAGDCVTRSIAIVSGRSYQEVYDDLTARIKVHRVKAYARLKRKQCGTLTAKQAAKAARTMTARDGVHPPVVKAYLRDNGFVWTPTMSIGSGTLVHVRADELPPTGRHVLTLSKHEAAWVDGALHDTYDCSRGGTRCVYGYWTFPG